MTLSKGNRLAKLADTYVKDENEEWVPKKLDTLAEGEMYHKFEVVDLSNAYQDGQDTYQFVKLRVIE